MSAPQDNKNAILPVPLVHTTFLDFAFAIHSEIGLHFNYATVDGNKTQRKPYEKITEGDIISVEADPTIEPTLRWFKYVKTNKAMEHLIKYLSTT